MAWFFLALGTAFSQAFKDLTIKRTGQAHSLALPWAFALLTSLLALPALLAAGLPPWGPHLLPALAVSATLNSLALWLYFSALRASDLSLTVPMLTFTPLFLLLTAPLILGEFPGPAGLAGILCIVGGSYLLKVKESGAGLLAPLRALAAEQGPRRMFGVALIWSVNAPVDKIGVQNSSPLAWIVLAFMGVAVLLGPLVLWRFRDDAAALVRRPGPVLLMALFESLGLMLQMVAITLTIVPYVIAIKRTSAVIGVFLGSLLLGEKGLKERLGGTLLMLLGVFLIAFA